MQHITVGRVVALDIFQSAAPELVSAPDPDADNEPVRWMHILETERPEGLLPGGEFILTTATFLDQAAQATDDGVTAANRFLDAVEDTGAVAVAAEILAGRQHVVEALKHAARQRRVPVYILAQRTRFVELTQYVHENIAAARLQEVETDRRIHEAFTNLSVGSASTDRIVAEATALLGCPVIWEATEHESTRHVVAEHRVVAGDEVLGRLIISQHCPTEDSLVQTVLERASQAVSISVLAQRSQQEMRRSIASSLFYQLRKGTELSDQEILWRLTETFSQPPVQAVKWVPLVFRIWGADATEDKLNRWSGILLDTLDDVGGVLKLPVFAARSEIGVVDMLLPLYASTTISSLIESTRTRFNARLRGQGQLIAGVGSASDTAKGAAEMLVKTAQIAQAAQAYASSTGTQRVYFTAKDLGLQGLLATLQDHEQMRAFVVTELAGLLKAHGSRQAFDHQLNFLEAVVTAENKAALARAVHLSRPALYARINRLEQQLGYSLTNDPEQRTATHLALLAYRSNPESMYAVMIDSAFSEE